MLHLGYSTQTTRISGITAALNTGSVTNC